MSDVLSDTSLETEFIALWKEYEKRETLEAKIVKDADNLDCDFELEEQRAMGSKLPETVQGTRDHIAKTKLFTKAAKEIYDELHTTNAHAWFMNARNRMNAGDWKK
jgi:putative hydrolase of HD superfamily